MVERIKKYIAERDLYRNDPRYEIKEFEVTETDYGTVIVCSVTGVKGDEGTMAEVFCRVKRHIFIGPRGGLKTSIYNKYKKKFVELTGWSHVMIFGYSN